VIGKEKEIAGVPVWKIKLFERIFFFIKWREGYFNENLE